MNRHPYLRARTLHEQSGPEIRRLGREAPRSRFLRASAAVLALLVLYSIVRVAADTEEFLSARQRGNVARFVTSIRPAPLADRPFELGVAGRWAADVLRDRGLAATATTLALSVAAIVLAGLLAALLALPATRTLAAPEPYLPEARSPRAPAVLLWRGLNAATRLLFTLLRALPEFVWAFLLLILLGPEPWAAVLAMAMHNLGILGRLFAETIENLPVAAPSALRGLGAGRAQIAVGAVFPAALPRFLLYFFYRFESCVRMATVLGLLGIVSLGYWIEDARARGHYDEMILLVLCGSALVLAGDVVSAVARRIVRRAR